MRKYSGSALLVDAPDLRDRLHASMRAARLGVRELAAASGVNKGTISAWHTGRQTRVRVETVRKVAAPLGTTVEHLLDMPPLGGQADPIDTTDAEQQAAVLRRIAALHPMLETLDFPTADLARALAANRDKLERLDRVLPELKRLVDDAHGAARR